MTGLYLNLIFVSMVITLISNTNVITGELIFKDIVNGVKFGELTTYTITNESAFISGSVSKFLEDKYIAGNILVFTSESVFTLDYVNHTASLIAGIAGESDYIEGVGAGARFKYITGACQAGSDDEVIAVDQTSYCLRLINMTTNATRTFAGQCVGGTPNNAFQGIRFSSATDCVYTSVSQEIFMVDFDSVVKLSLAQDTAFRYNRPDPVTYFSALTLDLTSENIYLTSSASTFFKFNITTNQFTAINSAANGSTSGIGRLIEAEFDMVYSMTFINKVTLLVGQGNAPLKVIDLNDPPSVSSICEYDSSVATFQDGDIRNCKLAHLTRLAYLPERSVVMVGIYDLATLDVELVNKPRTTAGNTGNTIANGVDSTVVIASRSTSANNGTTTAKKIDTTVLRTSFGLRTHPSVIILTAMITMPLILS